MVEEGEAALADLRLAGPAAKVLLSTAAHGSVLTVFVAHPWMPMDNNVAARLALRLTASTNIR